MNKKLQPIDTFHFPSIILENDIKLDYYISAVEINAELCNATITYQKKRRQNFVFAMLFTNSLLVIFMETWRSLEVSWWWLIVWSNEKCKLWKLIKSLSVNHISQKLFGIFYNLAKKNILAKLYVFCFPVSFKPKHFQKKIQKYTVIWILRFRCYFQLHTNNFYYCPYKLSNIYSEWIRLRLLYKSTNKDYKWTRLLFLSLLLWCFWNCWRSCVWFANLSGGFGGRVPLEVIWTLFREDPPDEIVRFSFYENNYLNF